MRKSKLFDAMPIISLEEGRQLGVTKGLVVNPEAKKVVALIVEQKGFFSDQKFISFSKIRSVGEDAVTISHGSTPQKASNLPEIVGLMKDKHKLYAARLVTEGGTLLGHVDEYYIDLASGDITGFEFSGGYISGFLDGAAYLDIQHVVTIGKEMIICTDDAPHQVTKLDGGLQNKLRDMKESTGVLWESTVQRSKKISSNVNRSIAKFKRPGVKDKDIKTGHTTDEHNADDDNKTN